MKLSVPSPKPQEVMIGTDSYRLVAFYYNGKNTPWDDVYNAPFLGNFWVTEVTIAVSGKKATFHTAEAAFQATKWWDKEDAQHRPIRPQCEACKTGDDAFQLGKTLGDKFDHRYAGLGREGAMLTVLKAKFQDKDLRAGLLATGDAYLLEHNKKPIEDYWSDNQIGNGQNRLGKLLMILRGECGGHGEPMPAQSVSSFAGAVMGKPD